MFAKNFIYDDLGLDDFGFMICTFEGSSGSEVVTAGSNITFNTVPRHRGKTHSLTGTQYDECLQAKFSIAKNPCEYDDMKITKDEFRDIMRWLNRNEFLEFRLIDESEYDTETCFYKASFNIEKRLIGGLIYGIDLTLETDAPFGYAEERVITLNMEANEEYTIYDTSDEIGYIYPDITITCGADGELILKNISEDTETRIKGCSGGIDNNGEVITIDGSTFILKSTLQSHHLYDDFNYEFFRIGNTYNRRENVITSTLPCTLELRYRPIIKDAPN